jgi:predicted small secreted protein
MNEQKSADTYLLWLMICFFCMVALAFWLSGCHTVHGIGQDLKDMTSDYVERDK